MANRRANRANRANPAEGRIFFEKNFNNCADTDVKPSMNRKTRGQKSSASPPQSSSASQLTKKRHLEGISISHLSLIDVIIFLPSILRVLTHFDSFLLFPGISDAPDELAAARELALMAAIEVDREVTATDPSFNPYDKRPAAPAASSSSSPAIPSLGNAFALLMKKATVVSSSSTGENQH